MEPNMALVLQRFEARLERIAVAVEALRESVALLVIDEGERDADGSPVAHIRVHQIQPR